MTPDELVALADALGEDPWYLPISKGQGEIRTLNEDEINFIAAMSPSLARDHAALLKWADDIAHATRRRDQALRIYWDYFAEGATKTARWRGNDHQAEDWWTRYQRYQERIEALLAEFDVLREGT